MKKLWLSAVLLATSASHLPSVLAQDEIKFKPSAKLRGAAFLREIRRGDNNPLFKARAIYPEFKSKAPVARFASFVLKQDAHRAVTQFTDQAQKDLKDSLPIPGTSLSYDQTPSLHFYNPARLISTTSFVYQYMGGAHGMHGTSAQNFGSVPGEKRPRTLQLADFFVADSNYRAEIDKKLLAKLRSKKDQEATWVRNGEVKTLGDMIKNFAVESDGLVWFFPPYAVGPYAAGEFEIKLTVAELGPNFKKNWILAR